ncbi:MAG: AAA family ATPase, partial [Ardenticatenaceae bacterium]
MNQLLTTKLFMPRLRPSVVERAHLVARLEAGRYGKLTVVSAPAGFGKTTLIAQWLDQITDAERCWLSLDASDNTFSRFVSYLIAALQQIQPEVGASLLSLLQEASLPSVDEVMTTLINELSASLGKPFILVLDDYHLISEDAIHKGLTFLLTYMPPELHLVLISRTEPPFPLIRLRARGQISEIRATDLRFSKSEATDFLNQVMKLQLTSDEVAMLEARTEGWIASLQLAALAIQSSSTEHAKRQGLIASFGGRDRYVADYLVGEVLQQQSSQMQRFLLETAPLERLCGDLCDYVRRGEGSQAILEQLEAANLFIVPLDHERRWYRYHHLFADLLRHRLQQSEPAQVPTLHRRASEWYEQYGFIEDAISHALCANAYTRAAELIEQDSHGLFSQGKMESLRRWMSEIPPQLVRERPHLYLLQGWLFFRTGQFRLFEAHLQHALPTKTAPAGMPARSYP